jgi:hypothetical protein
MTFGDFGCCIYAITANGGGYEGEGVKPSDLYPVTYVFFASLHHEN